MFELLGQKENDLTAAFGYSLARCPRLYAKLIDRLSHHLTFDLGGDPEFALETPDETGRTDLEVRLPGGLLVCEAKRDWLLPEVPQLRRYAGRVRRHGGGALVTLSQASQALALTRLPDRQVEGVPVVHLSWIEVLGDIDRARRGCRGQERLWLDEFHTYVKGVVRVKSVADSWVYCVVLNEQRTGGRRNLSYREWVTDELTYYHPYGVKRWPKEPPNFLAFRWNGFVQCIHRVDSYEVVPTLLDRFPDLPPSERLRQSHAVYRLSEKGIPLLKPIPNGARYRAARLWVLLDQLQVADTLADAYERSQTLKIHGGIRTA
ncbi:hypothetical protein [Mycobacterium vicinigordonae]|uniref:hypothetical protein n=1 Tax=Mycobacterium vicinigordonae TaxID=1719132 RepID=UPI001FE60B93|nr:hypothetical protein [Mycobacterium vicinigordonae]